MPPIPLGDAAASESPITSPAVETVATTAPVVMSPPFSRMSVKCEGCVDVVGVVTPLVRGVAQVLHGDQVVELSVQLEVQEREEKGEDGEGQVEVEEERGELKERRTCTWMTSDETQT